MNFQQLRSVREAVRQGFNLTAVADALHTSQPGVSRQIRELEEELGIELFVRAGKRLTGLTPPGQALLPIIERMLGEAANLKRAGEDFARQDSGVLTVAASHSQARYALPHVVRDFRAKHPRVNLRIHQGSPTQVAQMLLKGEADLGVATEALALYPELVALPCYQWTHVVLVTPGHPLAEDADRGEPLSLQRLAEFGLITYDEGYTGRSHIDDAFGRAQIQPSIVLEAMDADVIKTYVELGMGVGIVAAIAVDEQRDTGLLVLEARHLFAPNTTRVAIPRAAYLRRYAFDFIETFVPTLTRSVVEQALAASPDAAPPVSFEI
ncbi:MAG: CysB family HTH-type transcriptional regulator [Rubrivivax sp.]|jgi:LysR family cys regulon transcriptional activator|nr:CysB family HTH-type transcriptional regulator [Rubrivivax sp.]